MSLDDFREGDHLWPGGTTYGAILGPGGPSMARKITTDGGTNFWGTIGGMTDSYLL